MKDKGAIVAIVVISSWAACLGWLFRADISQSWGYLLLIPLQMHLFTGLFITAHDAMHGTASKNPRLNLWIGRWSVWLYAAFSYKRLYRKHHLHHAHVTGAEDPDFHAGSFWNWYGKFLLQYLHWTQFLVLGAVFNLLHYVLHIPQENLLLFWIVPVILSTLQLFYFGTYLPHRFPESIENPYKARTPAVKNHILGFLSCYFFGYHLEHHEKPGVPWWKLWNLR